MQNLFVFIETNDQYVVASCFSHIIYGIDLLHKSDIAPVPFSKMHHFVAEICTRMYISVTKWHIVGQLSDALRNL